MKKERYKDSKAFRNALEDRLKKISRDEGSSLHTNRLHVAFDRFLSRLFQTYKEDFVLKGGYSMGLRVPDARATKDIDIALKFSKVIGEKDDISNKNKILSILRIAAKIDLNDNFIFEIGKPTMDLQAIPYGGVRFPVKALMDNRVFVQFPIDVVITSLILDPIENLSSRNWLEFADIIQERFPTISKEQQFSEKIHAYTFPREKQKNSRVKDLIDLILLIKDGKLNHSKLKESITSIFEYRDTHNVPASLLEPPQVWELTYSRLAKESRIEMSIGDAFEFLNEFYKSLW